MFMFYYDFGAVKVVLFGYSDEPVVIPTWLLTLI